MTGGYSQTDRDSVLNLINRYISILNLDPKRPIELSVQTSVLAPLVTEVVGRERTVRAVSTAMGCTTDEEFKSCGEKISRWVHGKRGMSAQDLADLFAALLSLCDGDRGKENRVLIGLESLFPITKEAALVRNRWTAERQVCALVPLLKDNSLATLLDVAVALRKADSSDFGSVHPTEDVPPSYPLRMASDALREAALMERIKGLPD